MLIIETRSGDEVEAGLIGQLVYVKTRRKLIIAHSTSKELVSVDIGQAMRIREIYEIGDLSLYELEAMFDIEHSTIVRVICGTHVLVKGMGHVKRKKVYTPRRECPL